MFRYTEHRTLTYDYITKWQVTTDYHLSLPDGGGLARIKYTNQLSLCLGIRSVSERGRLESLIMLGILSYN